MKREKEKKKRKTKGREITARGRAGAAGKGEPDDPEIRRAGRSTRRKKRSWLTAKSRSQSMERRAKEAEGSEGGTEGFWERRGR